MTGPDGEPWTLKSFTAGAETEAVWSVLPRSQLTGDMRVDSKYYQPIYLLQQAKIAGMHPKCLSQLASVSDGNHMTISDKFTDSGVRYLRGQDLSDFFISDANLVYIPHDEYQKLQRSHMKPGDVLLSIVGTIGNVALVTEKYAALTGSCKVAIIRPEGVNSYYLAAYLASPVGQDQIARRVRGAVQQGLILSDLRNLRVPTIPEKDVDHIETFVVGSFRRQQEAEALYAEAEALMLAELGLDTLDLSHQLTYSQCLSQAWAAGRLDAEHFQPKHHQVIDAITGTGQWEVLDDIVTFCRRGAQPDDVEDGPVKVVNTKHLGSKLLSEDLEATSEEYWEAHKAAQLRSNDVLLYSTGAYIGRTNYYPLTERAIGSNHVTIIRTQDACHPVFLSLFLNTLPGLSQTQQHARGSAQREIYPADIRQFIVWLPPRKHQEVLARKVIAAHAARQEGSRLLAEAKRRVEEMILTGRNP